MLINTTRRLTESEKKQILRAKRELRMLTLGVFLSYIMLTLLILGLIASIVFYFFPAMKGRENWIFGTLLGLATLYSIKEARSNHRAVFKEELPVAEIMVEEMEVKTTRAFKREDPGDFGQAFYLEVCEKEQMKTLFLWGQYLDELEYDGRFPNTHFILSRRSDNRQLLGLITLGTYFVPEKTLPTFPKDTPWDELPNDGDVLNSTLDELQ